MLGMPRDYRLSAIWVKRQLFKKDINYSIIKRVFVLLMATLHSNFFLFRYILRLMNKIVLLEENYTLFLKNNDIDKVLLDGLNSFQPVNAKWISAARKLNINTITIVTNWDHPTSRGYEILLSDYYLVWGKSMHDEMVEYHDISNDRIIITGSIIFDMYAKDSYILSSNIINNRIKNELPRKYVLFLSHSPYYPYNLQLIRFISKILNNRSKLVVRLHPLFTDKSAENELELHEEFEKNNPDIIYVYPNSSSDSLSGDMDFNEVQLSSSMVANASTVINCLSTMLLDCIISKRPTINIGFDWYENKSLITPLSIAKHRVHLKRVVNSGFSYTAHSKDELKSLLLKDVNEKKSKNIIINDIITNECGQITGNVAKDISDKIAEL